MGRRGGVGVACAAPRCFGAALCFLTAVGGSRASRRQVMRTALMHLAAYLTRVQLNALLSDLPTNAEGLIAWKESLPKLETMFKAFSDPSAMMERAEMAARAEFQPVELMSHLDQQQFEEKIAMLFAGATAVVPKKGGGETEFCDMRHAYETLDEAMPGPI